MKTIKLFALLTFFTFLNYSCSSDSSEDITCTPIICLNNGVSNSDCGCDCPEGYGGENCNTIIQPLKVVITKVVVKSFSNSNDSGFRWDGNNDADIYIKFNNGTADVYDHPAYLPNAFGGTNLNYEFILNPNLEITNVNSVMFIELWDYDLGDIPSNADDFIILAPFLPFNGSSFPSVITVNSLTTPASFEIHLTYQW